MKAPLSFEFLPQQGSAEDRPHLTMASGMSKQHISFLKLYFIFTSLNLITQLHVLLFLLLFPSVTSPSLHHAHIPLSPHIMLVTDNNTQTQDTPIKPLTPSTLQAMLKCFDSPAM
jgi:hypothetical protein